MRKNILLQSLACLALFAGVACSQEPIHSDEKGEGLKITISCGAETKATQDGVGNENLIKTVDVFLFHNTDEKYTHRFHEEPGASTNYTMYIGSSFATEASYTVYTIVNYPYTTLADLDADFGTNGTWAEHKTLAELQALVLSESSRHTFTQGASAPFSLADEEKLALVMTGQADGVTISTTSGTNIIGTANIELKRLASKVTMDFYLEDELEIDVKGDRSIIETWTPITEGHAIRAYLCNGNQSILLGGTGSPSLFDYKPDTNIKSIAGKTGFKAAFSMPAFYTYPESWTKGDANEPYIKLIVQWQLARTTAGGTSTSQKETYYKVMLPDAVSAFESNKWYNFELDVTQLGATSETDAVPVVPSYLIAPWGNENIVISTLVRSYYLSVSDENKNLKFYTDKVEIPFTSSGEVSISSVTISSQDFLHSTTYNYDNGTVNWVTIDNVNNILTVNRPIVSNFPDDYDVSPYTFTVKLHLVDDGANTRFDQDLRLTQYPALYISSQGTKSANNSETTVYINGLNNTDGGNTNGRRIGDNINAGSSSTYTDVSILSLGIHTNFLGTILAPLLAVPSNNIGTNQNPNLYTVTATNLELSLYYDDDTHRAVIGDPRVAAADAVDYDTAGNILDGGTYGSQLKDYRPAAENTKNVIAPEFISASSYGKTAVLSYEGAVKRCAAYQEYGYPAGRWRLPTVAEIEFLQELNADGKIPSLFAPSNEGSYHDGYWAAGKELYTLEGFINLDGVTVGKTTAGENSNTRYKYLKDGTNYRGFVRCVYDSWYWGNSHLATTGTWHGFHPTL